MAWLVESFTEYLYHYTHKKWDNIDSHTWDSLTPSGQPISEPSMTAQQSSVMQGWYWNVMQMIQGNEHWESFSFTWSDKKLKEEEALVPDWRIDSPQQPESSFSFISAIWDDFSTNWDSLSLSEEFSLESAFTAQSTTIGAQYANTNTDWEDYVDYWNEFTEEDRFNIIIWKYIQVTYFDEIQILFSEWTAPFDEDYIGIESEGELGSGSGSIQLDTSCMYNYINRYWNQNRIAWESTAFTTTGEGPEVVSYPSLELEEYFAYNGNGPVPMGKWEESNIFWNAISMEVE